MRIAVVGDVLLDVDVIGATERLAPDAPVPVLSVAERVLRPGGAGLVAALLARDGVDVSLVTAVGDDAEAEQLVQLVRDCGRLGGAKVNIIAVHCHGSTPVKTRVRTRGHPLVRIDSGGDLHQIPVFPTQVNDVISSADAVVVADYGRGVTADPRVRAALDRRPAGIPLVWDPHPRGSAPVHSTTVAVPNAHEAAFASGGDAGDLEGACRCASRLAATWRVPAVAVTRGADGAVLVDGAGPARVLPAVPAPPMMDACGAGDRLAGALAVALADGLSLGDAMELAVESAARFVASGGVSRLTEPAPPPRLGGTTDALDVIRRTRESGGRVVATGGCFDLLHAGHVRTLAAARALGDCLVVCLNSDRSVRALKGPQRPIMCEADRRDLLLALASVDAVAVFDESTPEEILARLRPDVWVKGGDYRAEDLPETALLAGWGGRVVTMPYHPARSTTSLADALARVG